MSKFFSEYLFPANPIATGIITFLIGFFSVWLIGLIKYWRWLRTEQIQIENCKNFHPLVTAQLEHDRGHEESDQKVDPENAFSEFCKENSLNRRSPIAKHLKMIFLAGWDETRLEVGELINHTTSDLFKWNNLFRSMLAVFIVIGLFGTLFGLTDSLTDLSPALEKSSVNETSTENSERMTKALGGLLDKLKGALAPSISGIFFTILGVILYGIFLQSACHPVKSTLERLTLTVWVPQLYPTSSQKLMQTLQKSESQMQKGFETAAQFSESVQKVHGNIEEFNDSLSQVREITQPLSDSVTQINKAASDISTAADVLNTDFTESLDKFSSDFASSVAQLTGFQDEIRKLHEQFQEEANQKLNQFQDAANQKLDLQTEKLDNQNQNITKVIETIDQTQNKLETNLLDLQNSLNGRLDTLNDRLENFDTPLIDAVVNIRETFEIQLEALNIRLENFDEPLQKAAKHMKDTFADLVVFMRNIVGDLQKEIREQNKKYEEQLTGVKTLNERVKNLLLKLDESSFNQKEAVNQLSTNVDGLTTDINNLYNAINTFTSNSGTLSKSIVTIEGHVETLGTTAQQFVTEVEKADVTPLTANIGRLNTAINEISEHSQTLANAVNALVTQLRPSRTEQKPKGPQKETAKAAPKSKPSFWGQVRNMFTRKKTGG